MIVESYEDIIILSGALRSNFWETIQTAISLTLKRHPSGVIVDAAGITECTSEGAETFLDALQYIEEHDARIIVARVPDAVLEVIKAVPGVRSQLPIARTVEEARKSLDLLAVDESDGKRRKSQPEMSSKIVLRLSGESIDRAGAFAAINMAQIMQSEVILAYLILVPRELPLQAPLAKEESAAMAAIEAIRPLFEAERVPIQPHVERGREIGTALDELMTDQEAHTLIVAISTDPQEAEAELKEIKSILGRVRQSVMFVRPPLG